ncbi:MAG TPA: inositol-3-phosphate synthase [Planctomycetota bacterium]|nr:inositol-3-phosphate synthase [Planctomycetota bacterium]
MDKKTGVWIVGACGSVATCAVAGAEALKAGVIGTHGLVSELPEFKELGLLKFQDIVFGGHEIRPVDWVAAAEEFSRENGVITPQILEAVRPALAKMSENLRPGVTLNSGAGVRSIAPDAAEQRLTLRGMVDRIRKDLAEFKAKHGLDEVVVVHLTSAEPHFAPPREFHYVESFMALLEADRRDLFPASVLYALAAVESGLPYVNFTTCIGSSFPAMDELARKHGVPHVGRDGKTGETLMKTTLAPMFVARNLKVLSWEGYNMLGNRDGKVLDDPKANAAKCQDKDACLRDILNDDETHSRVRIDYVPSLGDWKTAWDFIHFTGFLGTKMILQFIWQGCDSALASPLVLDLIRFAEYAHRAGESGNLCHLACFFKAPYQAEEHGFFKQNVALFEYAAAHRKAGVGAAAGR